LAHQNSRRVALTLSDSFCVDRHRADFLNLIEHHIDILFANEEEIKSLYEHEHLNESIRAVSRHVEIAAITRGENGATIISKDDIIEVPAKSVDPVIDTTGAGDQFAAGFLYGLTSNMTLERSAELGTIAAAEVITHVGGRPETKLSELVA